MPGLPTTMTSEHWQSLTDNSLMKTLLEVHNFTWSILMGFGGVKKSVLCVWFTHLDHPTQA